MPYGYQRQTAGAARIAAKAEVARIAAEAGARIVAGAEAAKIAVEALRQRRLGCCQGRGGRGV